MIDKRIQAAAQALAAAQANQKKAAEDVAAADAARRQVTDRLEALEAERSAIIAKRRGGESDADDGPRLALIGADLEGLRGMLPDADRVLAAAQVPANDAAQAVQTAQYSLRQLEMELSEEALVEHARKLDGLLQDTLAQLRELHAPLGRGKPVWAPSRELWSEMRRLAAAAGRL